VLVVGSGGGLPSEAGGERHGDVSGGEKKKRRWISASRAEFSEASFRMRLRPESRSQRRTEVSLGSSLHPESKGVHSHVVCVCARVCVCVASWCRALKTPHTQTKPVRKRVQEILIKHLKFTRIP